MAVVYVISASGKPLMLQLAAAMSVAFSTQEKPEL